MPAGTVVGYNAVDFYLAAYGGVIGTTQPLRVTVMHDDNSLSADELQAMTFSLCHPYQGHNGAIKMPVPMHLAHSLCATAHTLVPSDAVGGGAASATVGLYAADTGQHAAELEKW